MVCPLKDLALLGHRSDHRFERGTAECATEGARIDVLDHLRQAAANRAEVLQPFFPQEPGVVGAQRIGFPVTDESFKRVGHGVDKWAGTRCQLDHGLLLIGAGNDAILVPMGQTGESCRDHHYPRVAVASHRGQLLGGQYARGIDAERLRGLGRDVRPRAAVRKQHAGNVERPTARLVA